MAPAVPPGAAPAQRTGRQRRPTGAPPPLPHPFRVTTTAWLLLAVAIVTCAFLFSQHTAWLRLDDRANTWLLRRLADARTPWLTDMASGIKAAGSGWGVTAVGLSVVALTMIFRRWRHLLVFVGSLFFLEHSRAVDLLRPVPAASLRRVHHRQLGRVLGAVSAGRRAHDLPHGRGVLPGRCRAARAPTPRPPWPWCSPSSAWPGCTWPSITWTTCSSAVALGVAIPVTAFRYFTPNEVFPVVYRRGRTAHVDVTGRRGEAIRLAIRDQLGLTVLEIKPVGLESSAGSTPLRLRVEGGPDEYLFAKLYTKGHVRADRWYKLWRTILYGSLEDESPFKTVRRLVTYEDYALRLLQDIGVRTARPYGIVEITPEREYMLVTEFFAGAVEIGEADVDDDGDRPGAAADPQAVGRRDRAPRHQTGQPDGPLRGAAADRRGLRPGAARHRGARRSTSAT